MTLLLALLLAGQTTPVQPMPKGTALPPPVSSDAAVMAPVTALLAGLAAHDPAAILAVTRAEGGATALATQPDGSATLRHISWPDFAAGIKGRPERLEESLTDPAIEVDGDIAMVWSPYTFRVDGKVHHCGTDHFDLVREGGSWKILNITWSSHTAGCAN